MCTLKSIVLYGSVTSKAFHCILHLHVKRSHWAHFIVVPDQALLAGKLSQRTAVSNETKYQTSVQVGCGLTSVRGNARQSGSLIASKVTSTTLQQ